MLKVGITGGIGSGKSLVARVFGLLNIPLYNADDRAKWLMEHDSNLKAGITALFGKDAYQAGRLQRKLISSIVFSNPQKLEALNKLVHPVVIADGQAWMDACTAPYALKEAALLFESDSYKQLDLVIGVYCPEPLRLTRVMLRDGLSREAIEARMHRQMPDEAKMARCQFVIVNDDVQAVIPQVLALHETLLQKA